MAETKTTRPPKFLLRPASVSDGIEIWQMVGEIGPGDNGFGNAGHKVPFSRFREYLQQRVDMQTGTGLAPGHVPQTTFWFFVGPLPAGMSKLRHHLSDGLRLHGGHIGYCIRPSCRGMGYGHTLLELTLREAAKIEIDEVLITVNDDNVPSWRIVETNGGLCEKIERGIRYYWVPTSTEE